jgi:PiT family inorganic phosphate transporter
MVASLLISAIIWNFGTWYFGIPASSSHTLIGSILGIGLAHAYIRGANFGDGVNWTKAREIVLSLLISPIIGFVLAGLVFLLCRKLIKNSHFFTPPKGNEKPPFLTRTILVLTCSGVSFAHGSNDGQKGVGLIMLILIAVLPASFALNLNLNPQELVSASHSTFAIETLITSSPETLAANTRQPTDIFSFSAIETAHAATPEVIADSLERYLRVKNNLTEVRWELSRTDDIHVIPAARRLSLRSKIIKLDNDLKKLLSSGSIRLSIEKQAKLRTEISKLRKLIDYSPFWVLIAVAMSLGLGTTIGWKRIVVTVGEKIGKQPMNYAQGASVQLVAMSTIGMAAVAGLPVSTTHVLSSGIAGTMVAQNSGLQWNTLEKIVSAWVLTLPISMILSASIFIGFYHILIK